MAKHTKLILPKKRLKPLVDMMSMMTQLTPMIRIDWGPDSCTMYNLLLKPGSDGFKTHGICFYNLPSDYFGGNIKENLSFIFRKGDRFIKSSSQWNDDESDVVWELKHGEKVDEHIICTDLKVTCGKLTIPYNCTHPDYQPYKSSKDVLDFVTSQPVVSSVPLSVENMERVRKLLRMVDKDDTTIRMSFKKDKTVMSCNWELELDNGKTDGDENYYFKKDYLIKLKPVSEITLAFHDAFVSISSGEDNYYIFPQDIY